ncbi:MAG: pseudouridylate synthase [Planctomycetes bacterium]|nr:pseudouridylate synthase [Planctomycetota bacterium]
MVVSKPSGILVHRTAMSRDSVFLLQQVRDQINRILYPVHRLDRPTSGALVFGLTSEDARRVHDALKTPSSLKEYLVLVRGETPESWISERPVKGKEAWTEFERVATFSRSSLLEARLKTGRRHQVRKQLAHAAHQVLGDTSYGKGKINAFFRETYQLPRLFLHAHRLHFDHPRTGEPVEILAPLAPDLSAFLSRLPDVPRQALTARWGYDPLAQGERS